MKLPKWLSLWENAQLHECTVLLVILAFFLISGFSSNKWDEHRKTSKLPAKFLECGQGGGVGRGAVTV